MTTYQTTVEEKLDMQETARYTSRHKRKFLSISMVYEYK